MNPPMNPLPRRTFLRTAGIGLALPLLDAMLPAFARAGAAAPPRRMVFINLTLGLYSPDFFPAQAGRDFALTPYLTHFAGLRDDFTVFSGLSHPEVGGLHASEMSFLTTAPHPGSPTYKNSISLDQFVLEQTGAQTRHPCLVLGTHGGSLSWNRNGVRIPPHTDPAALFRLLFIEGTAGEIRQQERRMREGHSVLDSIRTETAALQRRVGPRDRERLDQYFTAVRDVEKRLQNEEAWARRPKPRVEAKPPGPLPDAADVIRRAGMMLDLAHLALQTDSTRLVTLSIDLDGGVPPIPGVAETRHNLSHHGQNPGKIEQLRKVEHAELEALHGFLARLRDTGEEGGRLLDRTQVFIGSNLGNASNHDTRNLPVLLFGGGYRHGQHLAFDPKNNAPLANLFVTMLQRHGLEVGRFGSGAAPLSGLEMA
jgi:hypothetical protein